MPRIYLYPGLVILVLWNTCCVQAKPAWWSPFQRPLPALVLSGALPCSRVAPGFSLQRSNVASSAPIKTLDDLTNPTAGSTLLVLPRFGLGNAMRNWASAFVYATVTGRRPVLVAAGTHYRAFQALCQGFLCSVDKIIAQNVQEAKSLEYAIKRMAPRRVTGTNAVDSLFWNDSLVLSYTEEFWDDWWHSNSTLQSCLCTIIRPCTQRHLRAMAVNALLAGGPTQALRDTISRTLVHRAPAENLVFPMHPSVRIAKPLMAASIEFDVGIHIRTRTCDVEKWQGPKCNSTAIEQFWKRPIVWQCFTLLMMSLSTLRMPRSGLALSIFLATDNLSLRPYFVESLSRFGPVHYSDGDVAHTSKHGVEHDNLPTIAEFYLLSKSHTLIHAGVMSTFGLFSRFLGNGSATTFPMPDAHASSLDIHRCMTIKVLQTGYWSSDDVRRGCNRLFQYDT
jgi:hypothetical protein